MRYIYISKKYLLVLSTILLISCAVKGAIAAEPLTDSTSLTIVNVVEFKWGSVDITQWEGAWPEDYDDLIDPETHEYEVYLYDVDFDTHLMSWQTNPHLTPYPAFTNTINSMIAAVWSLDGGKTYMLGSWDYLASSTHAKGIHGGMPNCWMGTMVHSICDRKADECNGRYRSNLYFSEYPSGADCWGTLE